MPQVADPEYEGSAARDLAEFEVVYLFGDGIAERLGARATA